MLGAFEVELGAAFEVEGHVLAGQGAVEVEGHVLAGQGAVEVEGHVLAGQGGAVLAVEVELGAVAFLSGLDVNAGQGGAEDEGVEALAFLAVPLVLAFEVEGHVLAVEALAFLAVLFLDVAALHLLGALRGARRGAGGGGLPLRAR